MSRGAKRQPTLPRHNVNVFDGVVCGFGRVKVEKCLTGEGPGRMGLDLARKVGSSSVLSESPTKPSFVFSGTRIGWGRAFPLASAGSTFRARSSSAFVRRAWSAVSTSILMYYSIMYAHCDICLQTLLFIMPHVRTHAVGGPNIHDMQHSIGICGMQSHYCCSAEAWR